MKKYIAILSVTLIVLLSLVLVVNPALADGGTATANVTLSEITVGEYQEDVGVTVGGTVTITAMSGVNGKDSVAYASSNGSVSITSDDGDIVYEDANPLEEEDTDFDVNSASADASQVYTWSFVLTDSGIYVISHSGTAYVSYNKNGIGTGDVVVATDTDTAEISVTISEGTDGGTVVTSNSTAGTSNNTGGTSNSTGETSNSTAGSSSTEGTSGTGETSGTGNTGNIEESGVDEGILYLMTLEESGQFYLVLRFGWGASDFLYDNVKDDWSNQIKNSITAFGVYDGTRYMFSIPEDTVISRHDGDHVTGVFLSAFDEDTVTSTYSEMVFSNPVTVYRCEGDWYRDVDGYWTGGTLVEIGRFTEIVDFTAILENS